MTELVAFKKIPFSVLLANIEQPRNYNDYICHAAEDIQCDEYRWWCDDVYTHTELRRIMPDYIHAANEGTLSNWVKNMPSHLRKMRYNNTHRAFRISFLRWAIKKFGDQEINFRFVADDGTDDGTDE